MNRWWFLYIFKQKNIKFKFIAFLDPKNNVSVARDFNYNRSECFCPVPQAKIHCGKKRMKEKQKIKVISHKARKPIILTRNYIWITVKRCEITNQEQGGKYACEEVCGNHGHKQK